MKTTFIIAGAAVVAAGATVFALASRQGPAPQSAPEPRAAVTQSVAPQSMEAEQTGTGYETTTAPAPKQKTRGLEFQVTAGKMGTVCETPSGSVCKVAPSAINSRCDCDGSVGRIVR